MCLISNSVANRHSCTTTKVKWGKGSRVCFSLLTYYHVKAHNSEMSAKRALPRVFVMQYGDPLTERLTSVC